MENRNQSDPKNLLSDSDGDDVILDLIEEVTPGDGDSEEIIELTDFVDVPEKSIEALPAEADRGSGSAPEDGEIIELSDEALPDAAERPGDLLFEPNAPVSEEAETVPEAGSIQEEMNPADASLKEIMLFDSTPEKDLEPDLACDFVDSLGMDLGTEVDIESGLSRTQVQAMQKPEEVLPPEPPADESPVSGGIEAGAPAANGIDEEQLRTAVERAVERILSEKLEPILIGAIEKAVAREIEKLKRLLLEDLPDPETE